MPTKKKTSGKSKPAPRSRPAKRSKGELSDEAVTHASGGLGFPACDGGAKDAS